MFRFERAQDLTQVRKERAEPGEGRGRAGAKPGAGRTLGRTLSGRGRGWRAWQGFGQTREGLSVIRPSSTTEGAPQTGHHVRVTPCVGLGWAPSSCSSPAPPWGHNLRVTPPAGGVGIPAGGACLGFTPALTTQSSRHHLCWVLHDRLPQEPLGPPACDWQALRKPPPPAHPDGECQEDGQGRAGRGVGRSDPALVAVGRRLGSLSADRSSRRQAARHRVAAWPGDPTPQ